MQETIDALLLEEWKNDMNSELLSIDQILPNAYAGSIHDGGEKAIVMRQWIKNVLRKIIYYKVEHRRSLKEAVSRLQHALSHDIVMNDVVPFLKLPQHTFDGEEIEHICINESIDETYSATVNSNEEEEEDNHDDSEGGAPDTGEEEKQEGANGEERRKRQRTGNNGGDR